MKEIKLNLENKTISLIGHINFDNIVNTINLFEEKTKNIDLIEIDLKNLYNSNSAVLLFIINCIRYSMKTKKEIFFINISKILLETSKVYNLDDVINEKIKGELK